MEFFTIFLVSLYSNECDYAIQVYSFRLFGVYELNVCVTAHHQYNDVSNKRNETTFSLINLFNSVLQVSGDKFAHPQEHFLTIYSQKLLLRMGEFVPRNM